MEKEILVNLLNEKRSISEISAITNLAETTVRYWIRKYNLVPNNIKKTWEDFEMLAALKKHTTIADVLRELNLSIRPGNYRTVQDFIVKNDIDISHMTGKKSGKGGLLKIPLSDVLVESSSYSRRLLKKRLLKTGMLSNICSICGQKETWNGKPLRMILDHINGINNDNRLENLRMICPNCGSQCETFCRGNRSENLIRNNRYFESKKCKRCNGLIHRSCKGGYCTVCSGILSRKVCRPTLEVLSSDIKEMSWVAIGKKYGVSDNAVRKWARSYGILE